MQILIPEHDLKQIDLKLKPLINQLENKTIFITGATGFFGKWIVSTLDYLSVQNKLNLKLILLSRDIQKAQHLFININSIEKYIQGNIESFQSDFTADFIIHGAMNADSKYHHQNPEKSKNESSHGIVNLLTQLKKMRISKILNLSSGAVYQDTNKAIETDIISQDSLDPYVNGKVNIESMLNDFADNEKVECVHARCFSFIGPYMPLQGSFAAGNFINNAIQSQPVEINGDPQTIRSFMYMSDLMIWLMTILIRGRNGHAYNVGSDEYLSLGEFAELIVDCSVAPEVKLNRTDNQLNHQKKNIYSPDIHKPKNELGLDITVKIKDAIIKTIDWYKVNQ